MFNTSITSEQLNSFSKGNMIEHLGIEFLEVYPEYFTARMPVDHRTKQPFGLLHGGASVVLAETMGSIATMLVAKDPETMKAVGVEINANHLKAVREGWVIGTCSPIRIGRTMHVYDIKIHNEQADLVCVSRLTVAILSA
ncbi:hotdog fold thioesterase [Aquirufa nivalisilvae]|uniref:hotdog fold thioesterase n=1 Tax=Aquirufa nivalisilvae TaxID=2516557 RepID=UPI0022A9184A|nr:hotdog fold thioesterase [Aquirufa nivalisilvae]MCZ2483481.1 hotdog fold thioesterase [Aquirufa nivalisilvae]